MNSSRKALQHTLQRCLLIPKKNIRTFYQPAFVTNNAINAIPNSSSFSTSSFQPPAKNIYNAEAVYDNIPIEDTDQTPTSLTRKNDSNAVYVVTGASRSMGLQYIKTLLEPTRTHPSSSIIACCRSPSTATALNSYLQTLEPKTRERIEIQPLDITNDDDIDSLSTYIQEKHNRVDVLLNVAGVLGDSKNTPGPERNVKALDRKWFQSQFEVNTIGPMMLTKALSPFMKVSKKEMKAGTRAHSIVLNMSARVGSIGDNVGGLGWHTYRMSKAALNMGTRTLAHELGRSGIWTIALYPGFTDTDMSVPFQRPGMKEKGMLFPPDFTVERMLDVVENMEQKHSGGLYDWSGIALPF